MAITFASISDAIASAKQAVHDLEAAKWILHADPLTFQEGADLTNLVGSAERQLQQTITTLKG